MPLDCHKSDHSIPSSLICHQVKNKPKFTYLCPLKIVEEIFPEDISQQPDCRTSSNITIRRQETIENSHLENSHLGDQQTFYDISNLKNLAGLNINKAIFVKMKCKNYAKNYKVIVNCIGKGAFGTVRKVQSLISKELRAAKCIRKNSMKQQELQKLLVQVYIMMQLDHPNIANILEVYDYKNQFTLICELCQGGDLAKYIKNVNKRKKQQKFIAFLMKQLLRTVMYLHNKGIVHRDIKPQNILFEKHNSHNIKLIDFGITTKISPNQYLTTRIGTPAYMAPEIITQSYTEKVDVWATGVTMYHLLCGHIPFRGDSIKQIMHQIIKCEIQFNDDAWKTVSPQCIKVIKLMLTKNYMERPSAKQIFHHPYFQKIGDEDLPEQDKAQFVDNIRKFQFKNKLQAAIQTFIASQLLSMEEKNELVSFFRQFDKDSDGVISTNELKIGLQKRKKISAERIQTLMNVIDTNGSGKIDYTEFLAAGFIDAKSFTIERLKQAFAHFDTNGNGRISFEQVMDFMKQFGDRQEEVQELFLQFDTNRDGSISQDQFISLMLERSKHLNLSKLKSTHRQSQFQKRQDPMDLNKLCFDFMFPLGNNFVQAKSLSSDYRKMGQSKSAVDHLI